MRLISITHMGMSANAYGAADDVQKFPLGTRMLGVQSDISATANVLNGGGGEFIYCQVGGALACGAPVALSSLSWTVAGLAATANASDVVGVAANRFTTAGQFGWVQVSGQAPVVTNGTFAAAANVFKQAAGVLSTTVLAGGQILGMRSLVAQAATFAKANTKVLNGSTQVRMLDTTGLFAGLTISGTGIPGATTVLDIDVGGGLVTMSAAATASGVVTATLTYTSVGGVIMNHPHGQGQIT